jgi:hypothetical protein
MWTRIDMRRKKIENSNDLAEGDKSISQSLSLKLDSQCHDPAAPELPVINVRCGPG